jgi:hypothetical protein
MSMLFVRRIMTLPMALWLGLTHMTIAGASELCPAEQPTAQLPGDPQLCAELDAAVRRPSALPLDQYEAKLDAWLGAFCHRREADGWKVDKAIRDTGPYISSLTDGKWTGTYYGTHAPVIVWYSPDMYAWLVRNRSHGASAAGTPEKVPDGAIMVKEMYPAPASACRDIDPSHLRPTSGAAIMIRDQGAAYDGWFWGWYGWGVSKPDWPSRPGNALADMGFGQYCLNCHASARDHSTFSAPTNIKGEPGEYLNFLSQEFWQRASRQARESAAPALDHHESVAVEVGATISRDQATLLRTPSAFLSAIGLPRHAIPTAETVARMPSPVFDNVWVPAGGPTIHSEFVTSDQCLGCHSAGSTGLHFDMTEPGPGGKLLNMSPYGTWRYTPMGLAGRDPVFFAQLASETQQFHPEISPVVQSACLGCHGVMGQRQFTIDRADTPGEPCEAFLRTHVDAVPYPAGNPGAAFANYGALARDGVSCAVCHHMTTGNEAGARVKDQPQNRCVVARQAFLNGTNTGFARTFTGSFLLGPPDAIHGPFADPKTVPMRNALGMAPVHDPAIQSSEACGSCHTVRLPVMQGEAMLGRTYEQTTYAEWAFSAYRTGATPDGALPTGGGARAQSCQSCHMPNVDARGDPYRSKIASIQEVSNFPQAENVLPARELDLPVRSGYAKHVLVGLNLFLLKMAQQFPGVLGVATHDPMLGQRGADPSHVTEQAMLDQAVRRTADVSVDALSVMDGALNATVRVVNKTGHKFPSGVGFRRAFIEFRALDADGNTLWASGRTNDGGVLVDEAGQPIAGERWWTEDCAARIAPDARAHQPHWREITRQDQAQVFEELVAAPPAANGGQCGRHAAPGGPLTTSFLSICAPIKDNRLLPDGFLPMPQRTEIAYALGADEYLADDAGAIAVGDDPGYETGGTSAVTYRIDLARLPARPTSVVATLYYQATPPYFLQDRLCTAQGADPQRLAYLTSELDLAHGPAESWKLRLVTTGPITLPH